MNEQLLKEIRLVSRWTRPACDTKRGIGNKRVQFAARIAACLLLIGILLPAALCVAQQQDPREAVIAADLAAGADIGVIIQNAVAAGMSVDKAVATLVTAGADPGKVAYVAITANFPAADVVRGASSAITNMGLSDTAALTQITTIVSAATAAGATQSQVNGGLLNAGVPPATIANANTRAVQTPAPVYGYTAPVSTPPATAGIGGAVGGGGGGGGAIGGSGVGAPPTEASGTKPASPTKPKE